MTEEGVKYALLEKRFSSPGFQFYFLGLVEDCKRCSYKGVCGKLKPGALYEVVRVKEREVKCLLVDEEMKVVEVIEVPIEVAVEEEKSLGTVFTYVPPEECEEECENYILCNLPKILRGRKLKIVEKVGETVCKKNGKKLVILKVFPC